TNTQISELPEHIAQLANLQSLDLSNTQISELPEHIAQLANLQSLDLSSCHISQLPSWCTEWKAPDKIDLRGNPLPIPEVLLGPKQWWKGLAGDFNAIVKFYFQTQAPEAKPLYEAKLLIVGEGEAGKTTLAKKLQDPDYELKLPESDDPEKSTEGIDIIQWQFQQANSEPFRVNVWDFGGQEIYHATHQFFLTSRSLYALVIDSRRENPNFYYWLNVVRLLSDSSPVFIVRNEKQGRKCEFDEGQLRKEFHNLLKDQVCVNFADNRGLDTLKATIQKHIVDLQGIQDDWPPTWVKVRNALENYSANYITLTEYLSLCTTNGIPEKTEALQVSSLLHELGICLHFQKELGLKHYVILNPTWVTNAIYKVADTDKVKEDLGRFTHKDLKEIWSASQYADMREELLGLMQMGQFGICYPLADKPGTYIIPSLLSIDRPTYHWDENQNLILRYEYGFMPKGILLRLIVEMHRFIERDQTTNTDLVWKAGVVLKHGNTRAEIIENYNKSEIVIHAIGPQRRTLIEWIRAEIYKIHATYPNLDYDELIPCNCTTCKNNPKPYFYPLQTLQDFIANQQFQIQCQKKPYQMVDVRQLISDIATTPSGNPIPHPPLDRQNQLDDSININVTKEIRYQEAPKTMTTFNQHNHDNSQGFQTEVKDGGTANLGTNHITNNPEPKTAAEAAQEIQNLLNQLAKDNPMALADEEERTSYIRKALPATRLQRSAELILTATEAVIEEFPGGKVITAVMKKVREQNAKQKQIEEQQ
ncbi:MAG: COR domain-containing protein, partial [Cyanobacteria bacterium J06621_11]